MAKEVSTKRDIELLDGTTVTLRPASISVLKKIMATTQKLGEIDEPDQTKIMDVLVEASAVALRPQLPEQTAFLDVKDEDERAEAREKYEDIVDMDIVSLVNEICGGIKFDDPNLQLAATEAAGQN